VSDDFLAAVRLGPAWRRISSGHRAVRLRYCFEGADIEIGARRSVEGRLRDAYPVSHHDVELHSVDGLASQGFTAALAELSQAIFAADARSRRVVFAAAAGDEAAVSAARAAGFRYVLDVDVPGAELSLLVAEPDWVTTRDAGLDQIPES
jgi:ribosomal protein L32E